jgi:F-type H+-transporting ATPase subunit epsilon
MTGPFFKIRIVTPLQILEREIQHIRLRDKSGYFGIMKGHADFLTTLEPALGYYTGRDGEEVFVAVNGGVLNVRDGEVALTSREVYESRDAKKLSGIIQEAVLKKQRAEAAYMSKLEGLEKSFLEKTVKLEREKS